MLPFKLSRKALADLVAIGGYTQRQWGIAQRNLYLRQLDHCFHQLAENPDLGKDCSDIREGYRKFPQGSHLVFYKQSDDGTVEIIRILHKHMDADGKF